MSVVRVTVLDTWDEVVLPRDGAQTLGELKRLALVAAGVPDDPAAFVLKYRGAQVLDESETVAARGIPDNAALIALRRRRRAVR
jgi:hypothetical protein